MDYRARIEIEPRERREGQFPPRVLGLVMEWGEMHQFELMENSGGNGTDEPARWQHCPLSFAAIRISRVAENMELM